MIFDEKTLKIMEYHKKTLWKSWFFVILHCAFLWNHEKSWCLKIIVFLVFSLIFLKKIQKILKKFLRNCRNSYENTWFLKVCTIEVHVCFARELLVNSRRSEKANDRPVSSFFSPMPPFLAGVAIHVFFFFGRCPLFERCF